MSEASTRRTYRFAPLDRTGWLYGLTGPQCLILAIGIFYSGLLLDVGSPGLIIAAPLFLAVALAFARRGGKPAYVAFALECRLLLLYWTRSFEWTPSCEDDLPPFLTDFEIEEAALPEWTARLDGQNIGVVFDRKEKTVSATVQVGSRHFILVEREEQERLLDAWGVAIGAFAAENSSVARVSWSERIARVECPTPDDMPRRRSNARDPLASYLDMVASERQTVALHQTTITLTVDLRRVHSNRRNQASVRQSATALLLEEIRLLSKRLDDAGLDVDALISAGELKGMIHSRLSSTSHHSTTDLTLEGLLGTEARAQSLQRSELARHWLEVDGTYHHTYWIADWPRLQVEPDWMEGFLLDSSITRCVSLFAEPVPPSQSRRRIEQDTTKLATDAHQRDAAGFRIGVEHERALAAVSAREHELASGFGEFTYAGFVTVSAPSPDELHRDCVELEQLGASCGIRLESLDARHHLGVLTSLPLGRGPARRRFA